MREIRMAKMVRADEIVVGDVLVKMFDGKKKFAKVVRVKATESYKGKPRIEIYFGGWMRVAPDTEIEIA